MMSKGPLEKRERLSRICKHIIADPSSVDDNVTAQFKTAALRYAHTFYDDPEQVLKRLYCDEGELGDLMRGAVDVVVSKSQLEVSPATDALYSRTRSFLDVIDDDDRVVDDDDDNDDIDENDDETEKELSMDKTETFRAIAKAHEHRGQHELAASLVQHLHDRLDRHRERHGYTKRKESNMRHTETLESILKDSSPVSVCKAIVDRGRPPCGEHELVAALTKRASEQHPELSPAQAFAELYKTESVWRACAIAKAMPFVADLTPVMVGGEDTRDLSDTSKAIEQLKALGARRWPTASAADQFERALTAPENHKLARLAVPIPQATTSYPFPR
jgi:hypothetical protein